MMDKKIEFTIRLAGCQLDLKVNSPYCRHLCRDYIVEPAGTSDVRIDISWNDIRREAERYPEEDESGGLYAFAYFESLVLYRKISEALLAFDTLLMHGSAIAVDGEVYLFSAPSGTGKSTHTRLWREYFGERAVMVNDDKPLLRLEKDRILVCGTPWNGKHHLGTNVQLPLKAICYLQRDVENRIEKLSVEDGFEYVYRQTYRPEDPELLMRTLDSLSVLLEKIPVYRMKMNNFLEDAVKTAYDGMRS